MIGNKDKPKPLDFTLMILALTLTCIGILLVFDASYSYALQMRISEFKYVGQQAMWGLIGVGVMLWVAYVPYWKWRGWAVYAVGASLVLLLACLVPHVGIEANGARRWIGFGPIRLQPSEVAKLAIVLYVARVCAGRVKLMPDFWTGPFPPLVVVGLLAGLVAIEPDLGTSIVLFVCGVGALFFAGMRFRHAFATVLVALALCGLMIVGKSLRHGGASSSFQLQRLMVFMHPERDRQGDGYQIYHSTIALGSGGLFGLGIGEGREKMYLPEAHTDFIFAVLGEEGGLVCTLAMMALLIGLIGRGFHIATNTRDPFGALLAAGISMVFGLQTFMNIGVVTSSIPATGVPLPLISYGGSSLVFSLLMIGMLLNIAKYPDGDPAKASRAGERVAEREFEMRWNRGATLSRPEYRHTAGIAGSADGEDGGFAAPAAPRRQRR